LQTFKDKSIVITGGTGSFGTTFLEFLLDKGFSEIRVFSRDEAKQDALRNRLQNPNVRFFIGDVRERDSVDYAVRGADIVFHAAALKQVPSCEFFPLEAVRTNILGSANVLNSAIKHGIESVVCLSTDKAVMPVNAMGMSKAMMEKIAMAQARNLTDIKTTISCVRYGNVMYSRGSVIPLFIQQIKAGKPLTITDPTMTRFLMALSESVELVEFAFFNARPGDTFVKKAPACTIETLAQALKELFNSDSEIEIIGSRHGEKLYETLLTAEERTRSEDMGEFYRVSVDERDLNYEKFFNRGTPEQRQFSDYDSNNAEQMDVAKTKDLLLKLPEVREQLAAA
jgi:UDP-N-acetylglucosamine 4,6-dehydratase/5-epimerase